MERRNLLLGIGGIFPSFLLFCSVTVVAGLRALGRQEIRIGPLVPEISLWWLLLPCAIALFLKPPSVIRLRPDRLLGVTLALTVLAWSLSVWLEKSSGEAPPKAVSVYHLPRTGSVQEQTGSIDSMQIESRKQLNRIAGRRRMVGLEFSGYLIVPESGTHRFDTECDDRCSLRIGNERVLNKAGSAAAEIFLEAGIHHFSLYYEQEAGPASLKVAWDRPGFVELLPLDHYVSHEVGLLSADARRPRILTSAFRIILGIASWLCTFSLMVLVGAWARGYWVVRRRHAPDGQGEQTPTSPKLWEKYPDEEYASDRTSVSAAAFLSAAMLNLPFVLFHPEWTLVELPLLRSFAINCVLFLVPGIPFAGAIFGRRKLGLGSLAWAVALSFGIFVGVVTLFYLAGWPLSSDRAWNATWIVTNIGLLVCVLSGRPTTWALSFDMRMWRVGGTLFLMAYLLYFFGASRVVPPQSDHDLEVQGTGYGLLTRLEPLLLTDRGTFYYFAHPFLLHYYVAGTFLYFNQIDHLAYYDDASQRALAASRGEPFTLPTRTGERRIVRLEGPNYVVDPPFENGSRRISVEALEQRMIYGHYASNPHRLTTRSPNVFMAALTVALLGVWIHRIAPGWFAILLGLSYATSPEVFVRSSYGGYFAVSNFCLLLILLAIERWSSRRDAYAFATCFLTAALAALANHKLVLLPISIIFLELLRMPKPWTGRNVLRIPLHPVILGFAFGSAVFWAYGLAVDFEGFWLDHVRTHLADRLTHHNPLGYQGYPGPLQLWIEFWQHTGYALLPLGALALILGTRDDLKRQTTRSSLGLWLSWSALTAIVFSIVDWRMTKHLMPLMLPLLLAPVQWAAMGKGRLGLVGILFSGILIWNGVTIYSLVANFEAFHVSPAW